MDRQQFQAKIKLDNEFRRQRKFTEDSLDHSNIDASYNLLQDINRSCKDHNKILISEKSEVQSPDLPTSTSHKLLNPRN